MNEKASNDSKWKPGSIKSIKLINFMCHETFELSFGPAINFILGPNGSGKSALLTAIVAALGGRANVTGRGKKGNDFIMYGKPSARIIIVLHNYDSVIQYDGAYKPDEYGHVIVVEKSLYNDSQGTLVLKSDKGKKVSDKRSELDEMLDHFGILIDNPICILNQEVSKSFLHSKRPEDKFELFNRATSLDQIQNNYEAAQTSRDEWDHLNESKKVAWRLLDNEYKSCKEKSQAIINRHKLAKLCETTEQEYIWATVRDAELKAEQVKEKKIEVNRVIEKAKQEIEQRKDKISKIESEIQLLKEKIELHDRDIDQSRGRIAEFRTKELDIRKALMETNHKIRQIKGDLEKRIKRKTELERDIKNYKTKLQEKNALDQNHERRKLEIEHLEKESETEKDKETSLKLDYDQLTSSLRQARTDYNIASSRADTIKDKIAQTNAALRRLQAGSSNKLDRYGEPIVKLVEEIEREYKKGRFKCKPFGPIGYTLKLKTNDIAPSLEVLLGRNAYAFVCDNHSDMSQLKTIMRRILPYNFRQPPIITRPYSRRFDVDRFKAHHETYKTLLDYLESEHEEIINALLDRCNLESILFIPNYKDAEALMLNPRLIPRNTRCAYTKEASVMYPRTKSGGYRSIPHRTATGTLFSEGNNSDVKALKERELSMFEADLRDSENVMKSHRQRSDKLGYEQQLAKNELDKIRMKRRNIDEQLLKFKMDKDEDLQPEELALLEQDLEAELRRIVETELLLNQEKDTVAQIESDLSDLVKERSRIQELVAEEQSHRGEVLKTIEKSEESKKKFRVEMRENEILIGAKESQREAADTTLNDIHQTVAELMRKTILLRPEKIRPTEEVFEDRQKYQAQLQAQTQNMQGDPEEILKQLDKRIEEIKSLKNIKDLNDQNFTLSVKALQDRKDGLLRLQTHTMLSVNSLFTNTMRALKMDGYLKVHFHDVHKNGQLVHKARTLDMHIETVQQATQRANNIMSDTNNNSDEISARAESRSQPTPSRAKRARLEIPNSHEKENRMTDARSLSGGERSFSTVAFVLALWHHCSSPFRLMDEIDVFMDMVTRRVSYNALINYAEMTENAGQFLFFSPLELPKFDDVNVDVKVFEMPVIVRTGQGVPAENEEN